LFDSCAGAGYGDALRFVVDPVGLVGPAHLRPGNAVQVRATEEATAGVFAAELEQVLLRQTTRVCGCIGRGVCSIEGGSRPVTCIGLG